MIIGGSSCEVEIPLMSCLTSPEISRHKGIFAIEAFTNVEIEELRGN